MFDSNKIQHGSVIEYAYSPNGKYCAFTISDKGKSSIEVMVIDVESAEPYGNRLQLFSFEKVAWSGDSQGFFLYVIKYINESQIIHGHAIPFRERNLFAYYFVFTQYDPERRKKRHLYYHYLDEQKPDKLIAKIRKSEAYDLSFKVSFDYKYLLLRGSRMLCIANIENLQETIKFKMIFEIFHDECYVSDAVIDVCNQTVFD